MAHASPWVDSILQQYPVVSEARCASDILEVLQSSIPGTTEPDTLASFAAGIVWRET
jgi:hypothetical protein